MDSSAIVSARIGRASIDIGAAAIATHPVAK